MKTDDDFESLRPAYVAGVAGPADAEEIGERLTEDGELMTSFQRVVKVLGALKLWKDPFAPEGLNRRILERVAEISAPTRAKREDALSWGEPMTRAMAAVALAATGLAVLSILVTSRASVFQHDRQRACVENLRRVGIAAESAGELRAPVQQHVRRIARAIEPSTWICPVAGELPPDRDSSYLDLPGPHALAGDRQRNHRWRDANILMADGTVVTVTPAQKQLWDLLDPSGPGQ
jgi:anti-sigma factor RsiW